MSGQGVYGAVPVVNVVDVQAPETLGEGYGFEVIHDGQKFTVTVPPGGVTKGQTFQASLLTSDRQEGHWKTNLCDCCKFGCLHPSFLLACCCHPLLWAQVMTRLNLTWMAEPGTPEKVANTFKYIAIGWFCWLFFNMAFGFTGSTIIEDGEVIPVEVQTSIGSALVSCVALFTLYIGTKTRTAARKKYNIPREQCGEFEDCCVVMCCGCCAASQLARETTDYDITPHSWFSNDGLEAPTPVVTV
jgi:Cys-rich protein (TIGR01571 family)